MQPYLIAKDFNGSGLIPYMSSITTAIPTFWPFLLFIFWISTNAASYFAILKLTGKKRFFHTFTSTSFVYFIIAVIMASMNTATITFLSGYWVGFYILMTLLGWFLLENYK